MCIAYGETPPADRQTAMLNADIRPIYHDVATGAADSNIVGRVLDAHLSLRFCSADHLLFNDTQILMEETTRYQFVRWQYSDAVVANVKGLTGVVCHVIGHIVDVKRGATTPRMPHVIAQLDQIAVDDPQANNR